MNAPQTLRCILYTVSRHLEQYYMRAQSIIIISIIGVRLSLLVLRPLLAYYTSPGW
jgi:hypothetical protein